MYQNYLAPDSNLPSEGAKTNAGLGNSPLELWIEHRLQKPSSLVIFKIATDAWGVPGDESTREEGWRGELPVAPSLLFAPPEDQGKSALSRTYF